MPIMHWRVAVLKNTYSEKLLFQKIDSLINTLKGLLWKATIPNNNYSETNSKNLWGMDLSSFIFGRVAEIYWF